MKKYSIFIVALLSLLSCEKDSKSLGLIGKWELRISVNGLTGTRTDHPVDNGTILKFSESHYESYSSGQLIKSGSFKTIPDRTLISKELAERIIYDNDLDTSKSFFKIEGNKLTIWIDGYDAPSAIYERMNR